MRIFNCRSNNKLLNEGKYHSFIQFIKFGIVGISNSMIYYGVEMFSYYVLFKQSEFKSLVLFLSKIGIRLDSAQTKVIIVTTIAFVSSIINSYYWNSRYVFQTGERRALKQHAVAFLRMTLCYAVTGLALSPIIKMALTKTGIGYWLASLTTIIVMVPLNFILNKLWAFGKKAGKGQQCEY